MSHRINHHNENYSEVNNLYESSVEHHTIDESSHHSNQREIKYYKLFQREKKNIKEKQNNILS